MNDVNIAEYNIETLSLILNFFSSAKPIPTRESNDNII
jgi:hypothetical protein